MIPTTLPPELRVRLRTPRRQRLYRPCLSERLSHAWPFVVLALWLVLLAVGFWNAVRPL